MAHQSFGQLLANIDTAGTLYNTFTTAKSMLGSSTATAASAGIVTLSSAFWQNGTALEIDFHAGVSWATGNTMTISVMYGAVAIFTSDAIKVTTTGGTTEGVTGKIYLTCRSKGNGTLATVMGGGFIQGRCICPPNATPGANYTAGMGFSSLKEGVPAVGTGFSSIAAADLDFFVAMGTSSASNGWQMQQYKVINPNLAGF